MFKLLDKVRLSRVNTTLPWLISHFAFADTLSLQLSLVHHTNLLNVHLLRLGNYTCIFGPVV